ncbi:MAG: adenylosuccinate synthase [Candidatus Ratteibacteria bacterium]|nr:adenylosuccinate synthase [Candidatus Ratteibacteria bacterium]
MVTVVVGTQWGDEGKGKIIDYLAGGMDIIARYQGGGNAGHTVVLEDKKYIFHLVPSGILYPDKICVIGNGVVVDPVSLFEEIDGLEKNGISVEDRLFIAENAHMTLPYHKILDQIEDRFRGKGALGTTGRGIGTTYADKFNRIGIRVVDFLEEDVFMEKLKIALELKNYLFREYYKEEMLSPERIYEETKIYRGRIKKMVRDVHRYLNEEIEDGKDILAEGAQGTFLDIDFGTYPYVTASNCIAGGACTGLGISPKKISRIIGVAKSYTTRVGMGPFPTELNNSEGDFLRKAGGEYGATTGRPRRCGWFDAVLTRFAASVNGLDELVMTKLDVLTGIEKIKIAVAYEFDGRRYKEYPFNTKVFLHCDIVYEEMDGWSEDISAIRSYSKLPVNARRYIERIEEILNVSIRMVSVGSSREQIIVR